jgi:hypothetical protein
LRWIIRVKCLKKNMREIGVESIGILRYSPQLVGTVTENNWWLVIDCDPEIGRYFRHLYYLANYRCRQLLRPAWEEHISVVRNEEPPNKHLWKKYNGNTIIFHYEPVVKYDGLYCWINVNCPQALEIRQELGLRGPIIPLHLTVGNSKGEE